MAPLRGESHFCLTHRDFKVMETYSGKKNVLKRLFLLLLLYLVVLVYENCLTLSKRGK